MKNSRRPRNASLFPQFNETITDNGSVFTVRMGPNDLRAWNDPTLPPKIAAAAKRHHDSGGVMAGYSRSKPATPEQAATMRTFLSSMVDRDLTVGLNALDQLDAIETQLRRGMLFGIAGSVRMAADRLVHAISTLADGSPTPPRKPCFLAA